MVLWTRCTQDGGIGRTWINDSPFDLQHRGRGGYFMVEHAKHLCSQHVRPQGQQGQLNVHGGAVALHHGTLEELHRHVVQRRGDVGAFGVVGTQGDVGGGGVDKAWGLPVHHEGLNGGVARVLVGRGVNGASWVVAPLYGGNRSTQKNMGLVSTCTNSTTILCNTKGSTTMIKGSTKYNCLP